jgi:hypothetical protein
MKLFFPHHRLRNMQRKVSNSLSRRMHGLSSMINTAVDITRLRPMNSSEPHFLYIVFSTSAVLDAQCDVAWVSMQQYRNVIAVSSFGPTLGASPIMAGGPVQTPVRHYVYSVHWSRLVYSCCVVFNSPLQGSTVSVRNLKVSLLARDTPAHVQQHPGLDWTAYFSHCQGQRGARENWLDECIVEPNRMNTIIDRVRSYTHALPCSTPHSVIPLYRSAKKIVSHTKCDFSLA